MLGLIQGPMHVMPCCEPDDNLRQILVLCEACGSEGRILTSDGGPYDTDNGECPICKGRGDLFVECEPITMEDLCLISGG